MSKKEMNNNPEMKKMNIEKVSDRLATEVYDRCTLSFSKIRGKFQK